MKAKTADIISLILVVLIIAATLYAVERQENWYMENPIQNETTHLEES